MLKTHWFPNTTLAQGIFALEDADVLVEARAADRSVVEGAIPGAAAKAKEALGKDVKIALSNQSLSDSRCVPSAVRFV